jgi:hypothetical protein
MLPGDAPGRGAPGRGAPGRGAGGRGTTGRSTGCAVENGLLPTRGMRAAGFGVGRGPGIGPGRVGLGADVADVAASAPPPGAGAASGCSGTGASGGAAGSDAGGAAGLGPAGFAAAGAACTPGPLVALAAAAPLPAVLSCAGLPPPKDSRSRRATGASTVEDADLTNSPCSLSRARTSLLLTPSSLANSCTRALPATTSPVYEATAVVGRASRFSYDTWSSGLHGVLMFFATCSVGGCVEHVDVLDHRCCVRRAGDAQRSSKSSPPDRFACALRYGMQPSTPPRKSTRCINGHGEFTVPGRHSYHSKQFDGQLSLSATDTRPHRSFDASVRRGRSLALDHGLVYLHSTGGQNHPAGVRRRPCSQPHRS